MLEFNIDKQAGIQLHTCERKSRWCKKLLLFSWLLLLPLLLGWLFWQGFLSFDNNIKRDVTDSLDTTSNCTNEIAVSVEESKAKCDQQLGLLKAELFEKIDQAKGRQTTGNNDTKKLNQQLVEVNQKLKTTQEALRNSKQILKTNEVSSSQSGSKGLDKKLYFYEKILDISGNKNAVAIEYFAVKPLDKERHYRFQLLLAKLGKHQTITGSYDIFIKGNKILELKDSDEVSISGDKSVSISDKQLVKKESVTYKHTGLIPAENVATDNTFSFKYYQNLQGDFVLPGNFEVESLSVIINPKNLATVRSSYEWKALQNQPFKEVL